MTLNKLQELILEEIKSTIDYKLDPKSAKIDFYRYFKNNKIPYIKYNPKNLVQEKGNKAVGSFDFSESINFRDALFVYDKKNHTIILPNERSLLDPRIAISIQSAIEQIPELFNATVVVENTNEDSWEKTYEPVGQANNLIKNVKNIKGKFKKERTSGVDEYESFKVKVLKPITQMPWYHATRYSNWSSIKTKGLLPSKEAKQEQGEGWTQFNLKLKNAVYLTSNLSYAEQIADELANRFEERAIVIKIEGSALKDYSKLVIDEDVLRNEYDGSISYGYVDTEVPNFYTSVLSSYDSLGYQGTIPATYLSIQSQIDPEKAEEQEEWTDKSLKNESLERKKMSEKNIADKLGHTLATSKIRKNALPGLDKVYIDKNDPNTEHSKKVVKKVADNLNQGKPMMGLGMIDESKKALKQIIEEMVEEELKEFNAVGGGAIVGYTLPLGMSTTPGQKKLGTKKKKTRNK